MRLSQPQGLTSSAKTFLRLNAVVLDKCQHCNRHDGYKREEIGLYGMFNELKLYRYTLKNGRTADECIQKTIWGSGPMIWLSLKCQDQEFEWEEMVEPSLGG